MSCRIAVLGAGISGLAVAWFLKRNLGDQVHLTVIEKSPRAGGWIQTLQKEHFLFEQGPRSCRTGGTGLETLSLIEDLGLQDEVIVPHEDACHRYIYYQQKLEALPAKLWKLPFSPLTQGWMQALWRDWRTAKQPNEDETIGAFFARRIGKPWVDRLIDPFVSGIYAGDCNRLSLKSCFPLFDAWEKEHGSLIRGAWRHHSLAGPDSPFIRSVRKAALFSFKEGMETLPRTLALKLNGCVRLGQVISRLCLHSMGAEIELQDGEILEVDHVISTIPMVDLGDLLKECPRLTAQCRKLRYASVDVVNVGYDQPDRTLLPRRGFGYLIPSQEKSNVLGCVWDSCIFPQQNRSSEQTRLAVMLGGTRNPEVEHLSEKELIEQAMAALREQCGIKEKPAVVQIKRAKQAIPQYELGYQQWKETLLEEIQQLSPCFTVSGNAFTGVSINDCVAHARQLAEKVSRSFSLKT